MTDPLTLSDDDLLDSLERAAFGYFLSAHNPANGLVADRSVTGSPCSIAVVGFALSSYPIAVERRWMTRDEAVERTLVALRFFLNSPQNEAPEATGYKGFYYHFLDMQSGRRVWQSELSLIDTALLLAGILTASVYFTDNTQNETEIRQLADALYRRVDWRWAQNGKATLSQGWKPECGFLHYGWEGYSEASILYVLAIASPTHSIPANSYSAWTATRPRELKQCESSANFRKACVAAARVLSSRQSPAIVRPVTSRARIAAAALSASSRRSSGKTRRLSKPKSSWPDATIASRRAGTSGGYIKTPSTLQSFASRSEKFNSRGTLALPIIASRPPRRRA